MGRLCRLIRLVRPISQTATDFYGCGWVCVIVRRALNHIPPMLATALATSESKSLDAYTAELLRLVSGVDHRVLAA